jgi:hypothetical protein
MVSGVLALALVLTGSRLPSQALTLLYVTLRTAVCCLALVVIASLTHTLCRTQRDMIT